MNIWFDFHSTRQTNANALAAACRTAIDKQAPSLIVDYWFNTKGLVADGQFPGAYFQQLR